MHKYEGLGEVYTQKDGRVFDYEEKGLPKLLNITKQWCFHIISWLDLCIFACFFFPPRFTQMADAGREPESGTRVALWRA